MCPSFLVCLFFSFSYSSSMVFQCRSSYIYCTVTVLFLSEIYMMFVLSVRAVLLISACSSITYLSYMARSDHISLSRFKSGSTHIATILFYNSRQYFRLVCDSYGNHNFRNLLGTRKLRS